jgi:Epoxide hydrolase N terminus
VATLRAEQFSVGVSEEVLADLRARIRNTRWPGPAPGVPWEPGTDLGYLQSLLGYWADGFDWRAQERSLRSTSGRNLVVILLSVMPCLLALSAASWLWHVLFKLDLPEESNGQATMMAERAYGKLV